ncbi:hypothetical protein Tco_0067745, partial [Tanacetum coccineum]
MASMNVKTTVNKYNFKAIVTDGTANANFTFFTPAGDKVTSSSTGKGSGDFAVDNILDKPEKPTLTQGTSTSEKASSSSTGKGSGDFAVDNILDKPKKPTLTQGTSTGEKKPP